MAKILLIFLLVLWVMPVLAQVPDIAWVSRYNGPGNNSDTPHAMVVDDSGNVYVTGSSEADFLTIKYIANGDTSWVRKYEGTGASGDYAYAMAVDDSGNVYVTGLLYVGPEFNYATVKYKPDGDTAWTRTYGGSEYPYSMATAAAVDISGNLYVTGMSGYDSPSADYATIKYEPEGGTIWVKRYCTELSDLPYAITTDKNGYIYVTGNGGTISYDSEGYELWVGLWGGVDITADSESNVYVTGFDEEDYVTIKYLPDGDTAWVRSYNGPGDSTDEASAVVVDDSGNVYVTGESWGSGTNSDIATIKYYPNGDTAWVRRYNSPMVGGIGRDGGKDIGLDCYGNVYVAGYCEGWEGFYSDLDFIVIKYYPDGDTDWIRTYNGPGNGVDQASFLAVDSAGNIYLSGPSTGDGTFWDYTTIKFYPFTCGDVEGDGEVTVSDVQYLSNYLFKGGPAPVPIRSGDVNLDMEVTISDVIYLINYLFKGGPPPCE